jgi:hypothetical protein
MKIRWLFYFLDQYVNKKQLTIFKLPIRSSLMLIKKTSLLFFVLVFTAICFANEPIVLQNGTNSYNGCEDTYLATANFYEDYIMENYGDSITMSTWT